jgi:hypothetical protein
LGQRSADRQRQRQRRAEDLPARRLPRPVTHDAPGTPQDLDGGGPVAGSGGASIWGLFTFGYHPIEEAERRIIEASPPATIPSPPAPSLLTVGADCRSLTIGSTSYVFSFRRIGCHKATDLAKMRHLSGGAPGGYRCRNVAANGGVICWRIGHRDKRLECRLPGTKPAPLSAPK